MEPIERALSSEYDFDITDIQVRYCEVEKMIHEDSELTLYEHDTRIGELNQWYDMSTHDLLHGDGKSAAILLEAGLARHIEP
jgi:hypothetical protein